MPTQPITRLPNVDKAPASLDAQVAAIRACRVCRDQPRYGPPLPQEPRPILQVSTAARICIAGQAPGIRAHDSGRPFTDPSGQRLRQWLAVDEDMFYDAEKIAIIPMGFCFPGLGPDGSDLPPRRECQEIWRTQLFAQLPNIRLLLLIGGYAQRWHLGADNAKTGVNETVLRWRQFHAADGGLMILPLPHPSWRNSGWLKRNPWFEVELLPVLRAEVRTLLT